MIVRKPEAEKQIGKKLDGRKGDWFLLSSSGTRKLGGPYRRREQAVARERQVQFWKRQHNPEKLTGGYADRIPDSLFDKEQLKAGIKVEMEHTNDRSVAKEIAKDHLFEDPEYYEKLAAIEGESGRYRLEENPGAFRKVVEMHPDDRAIMGSAIGSAAGYMISPAVAPLGAAAGHIAGRRLGRRPRQNPSGEGGHRSLRNIAIDIKRSWKEPWSSGAENRRLLMLRNIVDAMQTLCDASDVTEYISIDSRGRPSKKMVDGYTLIGNFLANVGGVWRGPDSSRLRDELRAISKQRNPKASKEEVARLRKKLHHRQKKHEKGKKGAALGTAIGGATGSVGGPVGAAVGAGLGSYIGGKVAESRAVENPGPFEARNHNWQEVLIQKDGKRVTRKKIRDYYWRNRKKIWPFLEGQTVLVVMAPKKNTFILMRKRPSDNKYIKLTKLEGVDDDKSFEYWINRRVVEFHPVLTGKRTPLLWLDVDIHGKNRQQITMLRAKARKAFPKLRKIMRQFGVTKVYSYDSGIGGYHLEGPLKSPRGVDKLRKDFTATLKEAFEDDSVFTTGIAKPGQIRLDTTTLHTLGSLRAPYSYTVAGGTKKRI